MTVRDLFPTVVHTLLLRTATPARRDLFSPNDRTLPPGTEVLLLRRAGTGYGDGLYQPPGGYAVAGESPSAAAIRECDEEVGIGIAPADLHPLCVMPYLQQGGLPTGSSTGSSTGSPGGQGVDFIMMAWKYEGVARIGEPHKADLLGWYSVSDLPERAVPFLAPALNCWREGRWYLEYGYE